jgi:hypothetical protein
LVLLLPKIYAVLLRPFDFIAPKDLSYPVKERIAYIYGSNKGKRP